MKHVAIIAKNKENLPNMKKLISDKGMKLVKSNPDFVISFGGDGTFLYAERAYPGIPKLLLRDSSICNKCIGHDNETVLDYLRKGNYHIEEYVKLEAEINDEVLLATNDICVRNKHPYEASRFDLFVGFKKIPHVIGDGVVVSTVFGSAAYFYTITREIFEKGYGVAFNNSIQKLKPIFFEKGTIKLKVIRGEMDVTVDNERTVRLLKEGDVIKFKASKKKAKLIKIKGL